MSRRHPEKMSHFLWAWPSWMHLATLGWLCCLFLPATSTSPISLFSCPSWASAAPSLSNSSSTASHKGHIWTTTGSWISSTVFPGQADSQVRKFHLMSPSAAGQFRLTSWLFSDSITGIGLHVCQVRCSCFHKTGAILLLIHLTCISCTGKGYSERSFLLTLEVLEEDIPVIKWYKCAEIF